MMTSLNYNATTPMDQRVNQAAQVWYTEMFGNHSSRDHAWGWDASETVEKARQALTGFVNCSTSESSFTSCATESINTVIKCFVSSSNFDRKKK